MLVECADPLAVLHVDDIRAASRPPVATRSAFTLNAADHERRLAVLDNDALARFVHERCEHGAIACVVPRCDPRAGKRIARGSQEVTAIHAPAKRVRRICAREPVGRDHVRSWPAARSPSPPPLRRWLRSFIGFRHRFVLLRQRLVVDRHCRVAKRRRPQARARPRRRRATGRWSNADAGPPPYGPPERTRACSAVTAGADAEWVRESQASASFNSSPDSSEPLLPRPSHRRASSPMRVCSRVHAMSVSSAVTKFLRRDRSRHSACKRYELSFDRSSGIRLASASRQTRGATRLPSCAHNAISRAHTGEATKSWAHHEDDRVRRSDQRLDTRPPLLGRKDVVEVAEDFDPVPLQRIRHLEGEVAILAGIRNENAGLARVIIVVHNVIVRAGLARLIHGRTYRPRTLRQILGQQSRDPSGAPHPFQDRDK